MSVFLAATLTTFAIYCLVAFSRPGWGGGDRSRTAANLRVPRWLANTLIIVIGIAAIVGVVFATFRFLHTEYSPAFELFDAFTGRNAVSLLFGAITGVLLGAFVSRVFFRHPGDPIDTRDKIVRRLGQIQSKSGVGRHAVGHRPGGRHRGFSVRAVPRTGDGGGRNRASGF